MSDSDLSDSDLSDIDVNEIINHAEEKYTMMVDEIETNEFNCEEELVVIDRRREDSDVIEFQKTGDLKTLEEVYKNRIPTIRSWANKHYYPGLVQSADDLFEDFSIAFIKAAGTYKKEKGAFNTWLWCILENRLKNIKSSKYAKKRISEFYEGPLSGMVLSLDYSYSDSDGTEVTLKDIIAKNPHDHRGDEIMEDAVFGETVNILSKGNKIFEEALKKIGEGNSVASLIKSYKTKKSFVIITPAQATKFRKNRCMKQVAEVLEKKKIGCEFKLLNYEVVGTRLYYTIEMKRSPEADLIMKTIRDLRKNKEYYLKQIRGKKVKR